jgi:hypothetical protein
MSRHKDVLSIHLPTYRVLRIQGVRVARVLPIKMIYASAYFWSPGILRFAFYDCDDYDDNQPVWPAWAVGALFRG